MYNVLCFLYIQKHIALSSYWRTIIRGLQLHRIAHYESLSNVLYEFLNQDYSKRYSVSSMNFSLANMSIK